MRVLSICTSAGLWDKAWIEAGHEIVPGCEIMPHKRAMYRAFCGGEHLCEDLADGVPRGLADAWIETITGAHHG